MTTLQTQIEARLADSEPDIEVLLAEVSGGRCLRVFIDHPDGVTLAMCERVTHLLNDLRERYSLEVSSPGRERPLTKPAHFQRFVGRRARVRTRHPRPVAQADGCAPSAQAPSRARRTQAEGPVSGGDAAGCAQPPKMVVSFTGELVGASDEEVTLAADGGIIAIPYSEIRRSNLIGE